MKTSGFGLLLIAFLTLFNACSQQQGDAFDAAEKISVHWELITNFIDANNTFEARFTLENKSDFPLSSSNWTLFFNMAPRPILENETPQPATMQHINGDWYKLTPNENFTLLPGESVDIQYRGTEGVIKETDRPLGLYFVFYDNEGEEEKIVQVADYTFEPFTRDEQINRNASDEEPIPTPQLRYAENQGLQHIPTDQLQKIVPAPVKIQTSSGTFTLDSELPIRYAQGLENEANYLANSLKELIGNEFTLSEETAAGPSISLQMGDVTVNGKSEEAYRLQISNQGISITGSDSAGVFYGIQSLRSMIPMEVYQDTASAIPLQYVTVEDAPRFSFRGLHVDVSRNFQTKETILRILDIMSFYKLNKFLFYTTEDEGWRIEIDGLPELTEVGAQRQHTSGMEAPALHPAYGSGPFAYEEGKHGSGYYTREDFIEILEYAKARHIKVIPELNFPGHARAAIKAMEARYERFMEEKNEKAANEYRLIDPDDKSEYLSAQGYKDNVVSVARESTYRFYEKVIDEYAKMYAAAGLELDEIHAGGDEVPEGSWTQSPLAELLFNEHPEISDPKNLQAYFFRRMLDSLEDRNLRVGGWEEVALLKNDEGEYVPNPEFADENVVPYIWNNLFDYKDLGYRLANAGYNVVLCNVSNFYFDLAYNKDPQEPGLYWGGFVDTRDAWTFAPFDMFKTTYETSMGRKIDMETEYANMAQLNPEARENILGIEAQLWSETIKGRDMIEYYMLPKLIGFSESAWSAERKWETIENFEQREKAIADQWNIFANTLGQKELPRLSYLNGGYNYRVPLPGAVIEEGQLKANVEFPGLTIRYTTDGSEPDENASVYEGPVQVSDTVKLKSFDAAGKASRASVVSEE